MINKVDERFPEGYTYTNTLSTKSIEEKAFSMMLLSSLIYEDIEGKYCIYLNML